MREAAQNRKTNRTALDLDTSQPVVQKKFGPPVTFAGPGATQDDSSPLIEDPAALNNQRRKTVISKQPRTDDEGGVAVPQEMYDALKEKLYVQESAIKKYEEEVFDFNARIIEQEAQMVNMQDMFEKARKSAEEERDRIMRDAFEREAASRQEVKDKVAVFE